MYTKRAYEEENKPQFLSKEKLPEEEGDEGHLV